MAIKVVNFRDVGLAQNGTNQFIPTTTAGNVLLVLAFSNFGDGVAWTGPTHINTNVDPTFTEVPYYSLPGQSGTPWNFASVAGTSCCIDALYCITNGGATSMNWTASNQVSVMMYELSGLTTPVAIDDFNIVSSTILAKTVGVALAGTNPNDFLVQLFCGNGATSFPTTIDPPWLLETIYSDAFLNGGGAPAIRIGESGTQSAPTWTNVGYAKFLNASLALKAAGSPIPYITNSSPAYGNPGTTITITGRNFGASQGGSTVHFGGANAAIVSWSDTSVQATVPALAPAGSVLVTLTTAGGSATADFFVGTTAVTHNPGTLPLTDASFPSGNLDSSNANSHTYWIAAGGAGDNPPDPTWYCQEAAAPAIVEDRRDGTEVIDELVYTVTGPTTPLPTIVHQTNSGKVTGSSTTVTIPATTSGNVLVAMVSIWNGATTTVTSITAGADNFSAVPNARASNSFGANIASDAWLVTTTGARTSVTVNLSASVTFAVNIYELSHVDPTQVVGGNTNSTNTGASLNWGTLAALPATGLAICLEALVGNDVATNIGQVAQQTNALGFVYQNPGTGSIIYNWNTDSNINSNGVTGASQWVSVLTSSGGANIFPNWTGPVNTCSSGVAIGGVPDTITFTLSAVPMLSSIVFSLGRPVLDVNDVEVSPPGAPYQSGIVIGYDNSAQAVGKLFPWSVAGGILTGTSDGNPTRFNIGQHYFVGQGTVGTFPNNHPNTIAWSEVVLATKSGGSFPNLTFTFIGTPPPDQGPNSQILNYIPTTGGLTVGAPGMLPGQYPPLYNMEGASFADYTTGTYTLKGYWIHGQTIYAGYGKFFIGDFIQGEQPWSNLAQLQSGAGPATINLKPNTHNAMFGAPLNSTSDWVVARNFGFNIPSNAAIKKVMFTFEGSSVANALGWVGATNLALFINNAIVRAPYTSSLDALNYGFYGSTPPAFYSDTYTPFGTSTDFWENGTVRLNSVDPEEAWPGSIDNNGSHEVCGSEYWNNFFLKEKTDITSTRALGFSTKGSGPPIFLTATDTNSSGFGFGVSAFNGNTSVRAVDNDGGPPGAILIQKASGLGTATFGQPTQAGNSIIVVQAVRDGTAFLAPTDDKGNSYALDPSSQVSPNNNATEGNAAVWYAPAGLLGITAGVTVVTGHFDPAGSPKTTPYVWAYEVKTSQATLTTAPLDIAGQNFGPASQSFVGTIGSSAQFIVPGTDIGAVGTDKTGSGNGDFCIAVAIPGTGSNINGVTQPWIQDATQGGINVAHALFKDGDHPIPFFSQSTQADWAVGVSCYVVDFSVVNQATVTLNSVRMAVFYTLTPTPPCMVQLTGGNFQDSLGNPLSNGYLALHLNHDEECAIGNEQVVADRPIYVPLDNTGNIPTTPAQYVFANDALFPVGSKYLVRLYKRDGTFAWSRPQYWTLTGTTLDVGTLVPTS